MSNEEDLYKVITEELRSGGHLNRLQGEVRKKVLNLIGKHWSAPISSDTPSTPPPQILLLNQAIKEYLEWMGYTYSSCLFSAESGTRENKQLISSLKLDDNGDDESQKVLPILLRLFIVNFNNT